MSSYGNKKSKNMGVEEGQHIVGDLLVVVEKLQEFQDELEKVEEEASDQVLEVEQKYNETRRPVYAKRDEIIKSIPDFWSIVFSSHPVLGDLLNKHDRKIFEYLDILDVEDFKDIKTGYSISFDIVGGDHLEKKGSKRPLFELEVSFFSWFTEKLDKGPLQKAFMMRWPI